MILATFYLGCNMNRKRIRKSKDISDFKKATAYIKAVDESIYEASASTKYREGQCYLLLSIYNYPYRRAQVFPHEKVRYLRNALVTR